MSQANDKSIEVHRRIHLGRTLGEGGMGKVVEGFASDLGQHLAIKTMLAEHTDSPELLARFEEEVSIMASIDHPGNLPVYGITKDADGKPCYVMKKVEGMSFTEALAKSGDEITSLPRRRHMLGILLAAAETIGSAHAKGIIHRDIKPDNILIDREDSVFVIDWGIAKRSGPSGSKSEALRTFTGQVMGTPGYMSPEQADGRADSAGPQADVFALGSILYEILTGRRPFSEDGSDRAEMLGAIHRDPEDPRRSNWLIPRSINAICLKALNKTPDRRYPDAREFAADLRAHLEGRPVSAIRPNLTERLRYAARRRPLRAIATAAVFFILATVAAFIGTQRWVDHRLAEKAEVRIAEIDVQLAELEREAALIARQLKEDELGTTERKRLGYELEQLNSRWLLAEFEALSTLSSVGELRFIKVDSEVRPLARKRLHSIIERAIESNRPAFARALATNMLENHEDGQSSLELKDESIAYLRSVIEKSGPDATSPEP